MSALTGHVMKVGLGKEVSKVINTLHIRRA